MHVSKIHEIKNSSEGLVQILANISFMAKLSEGPVSLEKSVHNVRELIDECSKNIEKSLVDHSLKITIPEHLPSIPFDFSLIELLLYNLIFNAISYSPPGSTIEVQVNLSPDFLEISVLDQGKGIPQDQLDTIFEIFYRVPGTTSPGVGLGLAIAKNIAEMHGGYLRAENLKTGGAKFALFLPIENRPPKSGRNIHLPKKA